MLLKTKLCQTERNQSRPRPHQNLLLRKLRRTKIWWRHKLMFQRRRNHLNELSLRHLLLKRQLLLGARSADWSSKQVRRLVKHTTIIVLGSGKVQGNLHLVSQLLQLGGRREFSHRRAVVNQWRRMSQQWLHWWLLLQQLQIHVDHRRATLTLKVARRRLIQTAAGRVQESLATVANTGTTQKLKVARTRLTQVTVEASWATVTNASKAGNPRTLKEVRRRLIQVVEATLRIMKEG
mmetsp:Transcript_30977/g.52516  ORF Transcript_30977/g.52516 Transcript_30977/m.52516 type:complete len:236 (-) Transcript_30977:817-1524(-)